MVVSKRFVEGSQLTTGAVAYYTAQNVAGVKSLIKKATVCNTTASAATVTVYLVPSGGSPAAANTIVSARPVAAGQTLELYEVENQVLEAGDTLQALASAGTAITLAVSGVELS